MRTIRVITVSICATFLVFGGFLAGVTKNTTPVIVAQDNVTMVDEVEPNDDPLTAQEVPFPPPGETVIVRGTVSPDDPGGFSEDLETEFASGGGVGVIHDWYVLDPDSLDQPIDQGPLPIAITLEWDSEADVDLWWGKRVNDEILFFDGFKVEGVAASLRNPETSPPPFVNADSLDIYFQPQGLTDQEGNPLLLNDGFGRRLIFGVQHFEGPPANYELRITVGDEGLAKAKVEFPTEQTKVDTDFVSEFGFSRAFVNNIIVNRVRPSKYPAKLTAVSHPFLAFQDFPDPTGELIRVLVFRGDSDEPGTQPPSLSEADVLFDQMLPISGTIQFFGQVIDFPIDPPIEVTDGVLYVGFEFPDPAETGILPVLNFDPIEYLRTYSSDDGGETWNIPGFQEDLTGEVVAADAMIRATFAFEGTPAPPHAKKSKSRLRRKILAPRIITSVPQRVKVLHVTDH